jgi:hypothetical protein
MTQPLTLSAAMRLGAMLKPQGHNRYLRQGRTCALGAALDAIGALRYEAGNSTRLFNQWPILETWAVHPVTNRSEMAGGIVVSLNDEYHWTREVIADWVETIEQAQAQAQGQAQPESALVEEGVGMHGS